MKNYIIIFAILCTGMISQAQETKDNKDLTRKERKAIEQEENNKKLKVLHDMISSKTWIIQATQVRTIDGSATALIEPLYNYVYMDGDSAIVQIAIPEFMGFGPNNIGGVTAHGPVSKYQLAEFKENKQIELQMQVHGQANRDIQLSISIMANGQATAKVYGRQGVDFIFIGDLKTLDDYSIIIGHTNR